MLDFAHLQNSPPFEQEQLRAELLKNLSREVGNTKSELECTRAVDDVFASQSMPPSARGSAMHQLTAAMCAVLLRLGGANPASISNELRTRDLAAQRHLIGAVLQRMNAAAPEIHTLSVRVAQDTHDKSQPYAVQHEVPPRATPASQRSGLGEVVFVRLDVGDGVSIDVDEAAQRVLRKPERRRELMAAIEQRLERYFGG